MLWNEVREQTWEVNISKSIWLNHARMRYLGAKILKRLGTASIARSIPLSYILLQCKETMFKATPSKNLNINLHRTKLWKLNRIVIENRTYLQIKMMERLSYSKNHLQLKNPSQKVQIKLINISIIRLKISRASTLTQQFRPRSATRVYTHVISNFLKSISKRIIV